MNYEHKNTNIKLYAMATKVTDKVVTTNEDWVHIWVRSGTEHIRLTENAYNKDTVDFINSAIGVQE